MGVLVNGSTQYLTVADETAFDWERTQAFSVAFWAYLPANTGNGIVAKADGSIVGNGGRGWAVNAEPSSGPAWDVHITSDADVDANHIHAFGPDGFQVGGGILMSWQHVGFSYDGSSTVAGVKLYVSGVQRTTGGGTNANVDALSATILTDQPVRVGFIPSAEFANAAVADVVVVDAVLTATDFANLADLRRINESRVSMLSVAPDLWLPLRDIDQLRDLSGNNHDATATASPTTFPGPTIALDTPAIVGPVVATSPASWTHTPIGVPRGVVVPICQSGSSADDVTSVTYGGVAMTRVQFAQDTAGEVCASYLYHLGSGIPTGAQTVQVNVSAGVGSKKCGSMTLIASADTYVVASGIQQGDATNPSITLATPASFEGFVVGSLMSGAAAPSSLTPGTGYQDFSSNDFGALSCRSQYGQKSGENVTCGFTAATDDVAFVAAAFAVVAATPVYNPSPLAHLRAR